ncbi:MAG: fatty acid CoA ligase family protein [Myxococcota bacterium]|nr:fatty acid CoA ligase family protein [Myxococcota bacterium]
MKNRIVNLSIYLRENAQKNPNKKAIVYSSNLIGIKHRRYTHMTYLELDRASDCCAFGLEEASITRGTKTILMAKPRPNFFVLLFALFKVGAVPIIVDPGMGVKRMLTCFSQTKAEAFIGIPIAHAIRLLYPSLLKTVKKNVTVGRRWFWGGTTFRSLSKTPWREFPIAQTTGKDLAALFFTTGSTGPAKGVEYTYGMFEAQIKQLASTFAFSSDDVDLATFPLFVYIDIALGTTAVLPDMNPTKPARINPKKMLREISDNRITRMFASPALLNRLGYYAKSKNIMMPSLKTIISGGAPVSGHIVEIIGSMMDRSAKFYATYGATETLPISLVERKHILTETKARSERGDGTCVGKPVDGLDVKIIKISDDTIESWSDELLVGEGKIGEIVLTGDHVSKRYYKKPQSTALSKIRQGNKIWHRTGDLGWMDASGRIWFCGRKKHRVITKGGELYSVQCEGIFNRHPYVFRSALVGVGRAGIKTPVICIEVRKSKRTMDQDNLRKELLTLAKQHELTKEIGIILFCPKFPVDVRHNAKIFREELALWAEKNL